LASDKAFAFEGEDHLMDGRRRHAEVPLDVGFGRRPPMHTSIGVYEGKILGPAWG
jgi:hypothetical protein